MYYFPSRWNLKELVLEITSNKQRIPIIANNNDGDPD